MKRHETEMDIIFKKYYKDVLYYARSLCGSMDLAEEITQNTFYKAVQSVRSFRGDCDIRVWLCQIAKNDYLNHIRKEKRIAHDVTLEDLLQNIPDDQEAALGRIEDEEAAREIRLILDGLEEPYREVFTLKALHDLPYRKIAGLYGKSEGWARVTYYRAKTRILDAMNKREI